MAFHAQPHVAGLLHQITANFASAEADGGVADVKIAVAPGEAAGQAVEFDAAEREGAGRGCSEHLHAPRTARLDFEAALHGRRCGEFQFAPRAAGPKLFQPRCRIEAGTPVRLSPAGCHVPLARQIEGAALGIARRETRHGKDALDVGRIHPDVPQMHRTVVGALGQQADARQLQRGSNAGLGGKFDFQLGRLIAEIHPFDDFQNLRDLRRDGDGRIIARRSGQCDLSRGDNVDALQVEARQRNADHPIGQHEPRAGFGQAKGLRHTTRADQGQEKLRPAQIEGVEFDFPAHQAPPVERNRRAVHRDLRLVGQLFRTQAHLVEDETFDRTEPHAVELQLQPRAGRGVDKRRMEGAGQSGEVQPEQDTGYDHEEENLRGTQQCLQGVMRENPPGHGRSR